MSKKKMPNKLLVYVFNYEDGEPLYSVAESLAEIPEDCEGNPVGTYILNSPVAKLRIKRELA